MRAFLHAAQSAAMWLGVLWFVVLCATLFTLAANGVSGFVLWSL